MDAFGLQVICRIPLKLTDQHRFAFSNFTHTYFFAQLFCWADTSAHASHDVLAEDGFGRRIRCSGRDLANEERDIDIRGARGHARSIMAEIASVSGNHRFVGVHRRMKIRKVIGIGFFWQPARDDSRCKLVVRHFASLLISLFRKRSHGLIFLSTGKIHEAA